MQGPRRPTRLADFELQVGMNSRALLTSSQNESSPGKLTYPNGRGSQEYEIYPELPLKPLGAVKVRELMYGSPSLPFIRIPIA